MTASISAGFSWQYLLLRALWGVSRLLPMRHSGAVGAALMGFIGPRSRRQRKIEQNLNAAFPDLTAPEVRAITRGIWRNFGRTLAEYALIGDIFAKGVDRAPFDFDIAPETAEIIASGQPMIFVGAHISNWEFAALGARLHGVPLAVVYSALQIPLIDEAIRRARDGMGCVSVERASGLRSLVKCLSSGQSVGFLLDRRMKSGAEVTFFGRPTYFSHAPARLAIKFGRPLVPNFVSRRRDGRIVVHALAPIWPETDCKSADAAAAALTERLIGIIEAEIRKRPQDWLCTQRIWPALENSPAEGRRAALISSDV